MKSTSNLKTHAQSILPNHPFPLLGIFPSPVEPVSCHQTPRTPKHPLRSFILTDLVLTRVYKCCTVLPRITDPVSTFLQLFMGLCPYDLKSMIS